MQEPGRPARDRERGRRLPAIDGQRCGKGTETHRVDDSRQRDLDGPVVIVKLTHATLPATEPTEPRLWIIATIYHSAVAIFGRTAAARPGNALASASRVGAMTPRSVMSAVTRRAGVTSKA